MVSYWFWTMPYFGISKILMPCPCNIQFLHIQNLTVIHVKEVWKAINLVSGQAPPKYCMPHQNINMLHR